MGSSIYAPAEPQIMEVFGVNVQLASMGLSMYVFAYGLGPMLWSPLSEIPLIGRNPPYVITYAIFVILCVPAALVNNFPGLIVLRFLLGFFGSPCLATGGATLQDMWSITMMPYFMCIWALCATAGPALGPLISGFSVVAENWRWQAWEMLWLSGPVFLVMFFMLPETNASTILLHRARRLRLKTGNEKLKSQSEIDQANMSIPHLILENLYRPMQMMFLDPAVGFTALYTAVSLFKPIRERKTTDISTSSSTVSTTRSSRPSHSSTARCTTSTSVNPDLLSSPSQSEFSSPLPCTLLTSTSFSTRGCESMASVHLSDASFQL
jgi:DHA1 family multidrug resistance protein-like MFS transporter